jgi:hypothetical protein
MTAARRPAFQMCCGDTVRSNLGHAGSGIGQSPRELWTALGKTAGEGRTFCDYGRNEVEHGPTDDSANRGDPGPAQPPSSCRSTSMVDS